jgi:hypothetical protein
VLYVWYALLIFEISFIYHLPPHLLWLALTCSNLFFRAAFTCSIYRYRAAVCSHLHAHAAVSFLLIATSVILFHPLNSRAISGIMLLVLL